MEKPAQELASEIANTQSASNKAAAPLLAPTAPAPPPVESIKSVHPTEGDVEFRWDYATTVHKYVREYIALADQKAAIFFAAATTFLAFLYGEHLTNRWLKSVATWMFVDFLSLTATLGLMICAVACLFTVLPRRKGSKRGIVYFGAISEYESSSEYVLDVLKKRPSDLVEEKLSHVHAIAKVCTRKYDSLLVAMWAGAVGAVSALLMFILTR